MIGRKSSGLTVHAAGAAAGAGAGAAGYYGYAAAAGRGTCGALLSYLCSAEFLHFDLQKQK